ncbi:hypothetical protein [Sigmofec virus UA08Rod_5614]|uniref:Uncharacterized protein n=1 Tax=Sigmofec virus UA08Rod_5614 TaxID=2929431 RepID=A0A976N233_9VIRU|nr:hypothetical protein [Sigmofec virus UA08Rod_5614]
MSKTPRPLATNILRQNCYVRDTVSVLDEMCDYSISSYVSLDEKHTDDGIDLEYNTYDYPITPDFVESFAPGTDFRINPEIVTKSTPRFNYNDVSVMQYLSSLDSTERLAFLSSLQAKFATPEVKNATDTPATQTGLGSEQNK